MKIALILLIILSLFLENSLVGLPLAVFFSILLYIIEPEVLNIVFAFLIGLICDILKINQIGATSIFLLTTFGFIYLYKNTFELKDIRITIIFPFIFSYFYAILAGYGANLLIYLFLLVISEGIVYYFTRNRKPQLASL